MVFDRSGDPGDDEVGAPPPKGIEVGGRIWGAREPRARTQNQGEIAARERQQAAAARDLTHVVTGLLAQTRLALADVAPDSPAYTRLKRIETTAVHAADLAAQMVNALTGSTEPR